MSSPPPVPDDGFLPYDPTRDDDDPITPILERDPSLEHEETCRELARLLRQRGDVRLWDGPAQPKRPTKHLPGSPKKLLVMELRASRGEKVFHPEDVFSSDVAAMEIARKPRKEKGSRRRRNGSQPVKDRKEVTQGGAVKPDQQREDAESMQREVFLWRMKQKS